MTDAAERPRRGERMPEQPARAWRVVLEHVASELAARVS
jgi:hypothetical protein